MRIGIDVGGTNTDAVAIDGRTVVGWTKQPTTADVTSGIVSALNDLLGRPDLSAGEVDAVMIGTTHFTNAVVQRRGLARTAVLRIGLPATQAIPPFTDWPEELREAASGRAIMLHGGHQFDGREIAPLDLNEVARAIQTLQAEEIEAVAIAASFSPITAVHEEAVADLVGRAMPEVALSLSHQIGRIGLLERENASALNACLAHLASRTFAAFATAISKLGISAPIYLSQNDGTLMSAEFAARYPVLTFTSGPTNSMRGAAFLSGLPNGIVLDIGGTTTDGGALVNGFPREASFEVDIGGVRSNFRMPDVVSIGLGGGSLVDPSGDHVGPLSVGHRISSEALIFGGETLTASDIAVAAGRADFGDRSRVSGLDPKTVDRAQRVISGMVSGLVDALKTSAGDVPLIVVGGGSVLIDDRIEGVSEVIRPEHASVANAIGAAIAQVSGEIDQVFSLENQTRDAVLAQARQSAIQLAVEAGAERGSVEIVEIDEIPLAYLPSNALRLRIKAVGDLSA